MRDEGVTGMNVSRPSRRVSASGSSASGSSANARSVRAVWAAAVFAVVVMHGPGEAQAQCECAEYPLLEDVLPGDERTEVSLNTRVVFRFNRIAPEQTLLVALCDGENAPVAAGVESLKPPHRKANHEIVVVTPTADLATNTKYRLKWMLEDEEVQGANGAFEFVANCTSFDDATTVDKGTFTFTTGVTRDTVAPALPESIENRWLACVDYPDPSLACYSDCVRPYQEAIRMNVVPDNLTLSSELLYKVCVRENEADAFACFFDLADVAAAMGCWRRSTSARGNATTTILRRRRGRRLSTRCRSLMGRATAAR